MPDERPPTPALYYRGEANSQARLTEAKVHQIIGLLLEGQTHAVIAKQFGVAQSTIGQLAKGKTWKQVPRPTNFANAIRHSRANLTEAQVREIRGLLKAGHAQRVVALKFNVRQGLLATSPQAVAGPGSPTTRAVQRRGLVMADEMMGRVWRPGPIGEGHGHAKLTNEQARRIIEMLAEGRLTKTEIASLFGVSVATVSLINSGRSWRHIPRPDNFANHPKPEPSRNRGEANRNARLTEDKVREILQLNKSGLSNPEIAEKVGTPRGTVWWIVSGGAWKHIPRD